MRSAMLKRLSRDQRGITGLETAIILIAFVVVASVFAYSVLSAGLFSSEKGKEAIHAGLEQAQGSMELVGSVKATAVLSTELDDLERVGAWTASTNINVATEPSDIKEGVSSLDLTVTLGFVSGLAAFSDTISVDVSSHYSAQLWIKSTTPTLDGDIQLVIDEEAACSTPEESLDISALTANTWTHPVLDLTAGSALNAVVCVGVFITRDIGAATITIDLIESPSEVTSVSFLVANALEGEPINLTTTTDEGNGLLSDEAVKSHVMAVIYSDDEQLLTDLAWTKTELGKGDGDNLLEVGEKMKITVSTHAAAPMPVASTNFTITLVREKGADMVLERRLPSVLTTEMDLN